jgi:hypothetical protein
MSDLPWRVKDHVVTPDNVVASRRRYEAIQAIQKGTATAEQHELVEACDRDLQRIAQLR